MVAPMTHSGIAHVLRERVDLRYLRHRPMERAVEAGDLRQAGNASASARAPRTLKVWCDGSITDRESR